MANRYWCACKDDAWEADPGDTALDAHARPGAQAPGYRQTPDKLGFTLAPAAGRLIHEPSAHSPGMNNGA